MRFFLLLACCLMGSALGQNVGTETPEETPAFSYSICDSSGCTTQSGGLTLDSNWRWTHAVDGYENCYTGNLWDDTYCPDAATCTANCAIDGVDSATWTGTYGATISDNSLTLQFITEGEYSTNIGSRVFLLDSSLTNYALFNVLGKEFTFTADVSNLDCGLNGALYLVEMDADGGLGEYSTNYAGAQYGTGYCDAQCPHDLKWINGEANCEEWEPSDNDVNSGFGRYGSCCPEMDLWEANNVAQAYTTHPCAVEGQTRCEGTDCGDDDERYQGVCDKDGCDFASYRLNDHEFYGEGLLVDTTQPVTVVTQFITDDGSDSGTLIEVRRLYVQGGTVIQNSQVNFDGIEAYDSITDEFCVEIKSLFGDTDDHAAKGGLAAMGESLGRGHVLVMSLWDDHSADMNWLDSMYPPDGDIDQPGVNRGPCDPYEGDPGNVEELYPDATVTFSDIRFGDLDTTY